MQTKTISIIPQTDADKIREKIKNKNDANLYIEDTFINACNGFTTVNKGVANIKALINYMILLDRKKHCEQAVTIDTAKEITKVAGDITKLFCNLSTERNWFGKTKKVNIIIPPDILHKKNNIIFLKILTLIQIIDIKKVIQTDNKLKNSEITIISKQNKKSNA